MADELQQHSLLVEDVLHAGGGESPYIALAVDSRRQPVILISRQHLPLSPGQEARLTGRMEGPADSYGAQRLYCDQSTLEAASRQPDLSEGVSLPDGLNEDGAESTFMRQALGFLADLIGESRQARSVEKPEQHVRVQGLVGDSVVRELAALADDLGEHRSVVITDPVVFPLAQKTLQKDGEWVPGPRSTIPSVLRPLAGEVDSAFPISIQATRDNSYYAGNADKITFIHPYSAYSSEAVTAAMISGLSLGSFALKDTAAPVARRKLYGLHELFHAYQWHDGIEGLGLEQCEGFADAAALLVFLRDGGDPQIAARHADMRQAALITPLAGRCQIGSYASAALARARELEASGELSALSNQDALNEAAGIARKDGLDPRLVEELDHWRGHLERNCPEGEDPSAHAWMQAKSVVTGDKKPEEVGFRASVLRRQIDAGLSDDSIRTVLAVGLRACARVYHSPDALTQQQSRRQALECYSRDVAGSLQMLPYRKDCLSAFWREESHFLNALSGGDEQGLVQARSARLTRGLETGLKLSRSMPETQDSTFWFARPDHAMVAPRLSHEGLRRALTLSPDQQVSYFRDCALEEADSLARALVKTRLRGDAGSDLARASQMARARRDVALVLLTDKDSLQAARQQLNAGALPAIRGMISEPARRYTQADPEAVRSFTRDVGRLFPEAEERLRMPAARPVSRGKEGSLPKERSWSNNGRSSGYAGGQEI